MKKSIFIMAILVVKKPVVVLNLRKKTVAQLIIDAKAYVAGVTANAVTFPTPSPALSDITPLISNLEASSSVAETHAKGAVPKRDADRAALELKLKDLAHYVEIICRANASNAASIAKMANMALKTRTAPQKQDFVMTALLTPGELLMTAKSEKGRVTFNFELSTDITNPSLWKSVQNRSIAHAKVAGLVSGTRYYGRVSRTDKIGTYQVGQVLSVVIH
jgi:hypothetical protein